MDSPTLPPLGPPPPPPVPPKRQRHHRFAVLLLECKTQTDAYLGAGYNSPRASAFVCASRLRRHPEVRAFIEATHRLESYEKEVSFRAELKRDLASAIAGLSI